MTQTERRQFWLAKLDQYGNPTLTDGPHDERPGVEQALYLFRRLGLGKAERYACAEVVITEVEPTPHGANEDALNTLNGIGLKP